jgi:hypothetical protein
VRNDVALQTLASLLHRLVLLFFFSPPSSFVVVLPLVYFAVFRLSVLLSTIFFLSFFGVPFKKDCLNEDLCCAGGGEEEGRFRAVALDRGSL